MTTSSHEEEFGELRSLLQKQPDIAVFANVSETITRMENNAPGVFADRYLDYTKEQLSSWPLRARTVRCEFRDLEAIETSAWAPLVASLMFTPYTALELSEWRDRLAVFPELTHLGLFNFSMKRDVMFDAIDGGLFDGLTAVTFHGVNLNNFATFTGVIERLSEREGCAGLRDLAIRDAQLKSSHVEALCESPIAPRLRAIDLSRNTNMKAAGAKVLAAAAPNLTALERLELNQCGLTSTATKALAQAKWATPPRHLGLGRNALKHNALKPLDKAGLLPALVDREGAPSLDLSWFDLNEAGLQLLVDRGLFDGLKRFTFGSSESSVETFAPLVASPSALEGVEHLRMRILQIDDDVLATLTARMSLVEFATFFSEDDEAVSALSNHPDLKRLSIRRRDWFFGEAVLAELLDRPNLSGFEELEVYMVVPTESALIERARAAEKWEVSPRDDQMGVRLYAPSRDRSVRPLNMDGHF